MATKAQQKAAAAEAAAKLDEQKAADALRAKSIELSGIDAEAFDALAEEERQKFIEDAQIAIDEADAAAEANKNPPAAQLPSKIQLSCPFGFKDDQDQVHMWAADQIITDTAEIKTLIQGGAEHKVLE